MTNLSPLNPIPISVMQEQLLKKAGINLGASESLNTLLDDLVNDDSNEHRQQLRRRAEAILGYVSSLELKEHSRQMSQHSQQMTTATWVIAAATVVNVLLWAFSLFIRGVA